MDKEYNKFPALVMFTAGLILAVIVHTHNIKTENEIQNEQIERIEEHIELEKIRRQEEIKRLALESSQEEVRCLAENIYWEARNQEEEGRIAVAQVTLNRVSDSRFPNTICGVVKQTKYYPSGRIDLHSCQFSWYCDGKPDEPYENEMNAWNESLALATSVLFDRPSDNTKGALWYHSKKVKPFWSDVYHQVAIHQDHMFYTDDT